MSLDTLGHWAESQQDLIDVKYFAPENDGTVDLDAAAVLAIRLLTGSSSDADITQETF